jgi:hypothetical protein
MAQKAANTGATESTSAPATASGAAGAPDGSSSQPATGGSAACPT